MVDFSEPSRNPADSDGEMPGAMRQILSKFLKTDVDGRLPARVVSYDRASNRASVQPLISVVTTSGVPVTRNQISSIPVINVGGGGFILSFNFKPGDLGWVVACDRDIAEFLKSYSQSSPATKRVHDFDNGVFVPDVMTGYNIDSEDEDNAVFQSTDGSVRVSLFSDKIKLTAPLVIIDSDSEVTGDSLIEGNVQVDGNVKIDGGATIDGPSSLGGTGGPGLARVGDTVEVTVSSGSSSGVWPGVITSGSAISSAN